jgi:hypothetical protein
VLLCPQHHRAVHEGGWSITGDPDGALTFHGPSGEVVNETPPALPNAEPGDLERGHAQHGLQLEPDSLLPNWYGEHLDLDWAVGALCARFDREHDAEVRAPDG